MSVTAAQIEQALRDGMDAPTHLEILNESHLHVGHAGAAEGSHWRVRLTSPQCTGLSRVARHRLVYHALRSVIPLGIHALAIEARAPGET